MLFKYRIQHEGQKENIGFVAAATSDEVLEIAKENFAGWDVGSTTGVQAVKDYKPKKDEPVNFDLSWIHPTFAKL